MTAAFAFLCLSAVLLYMAVGCAVVSFFARENFIVTVRWWHVVFWPLLPIGWAATAICFWMAQDRR